MYDLIIIGAGPAGMAAGVAAAEEKLNTLIIAKAVFEPKASEEILGLFKLKDLANKFSELVKTRQLELKNKTEVINLEKNIVSFSVEVKSGVLYYAKSVIIATGHEILEFDNITQKTANGKIKVDYKLLTSVPGIWAVGGVIGSEGLGAAFGEGLKVAGYVAKNKG